MIPPEVKERSKLSKEEWREYTKTVWHIANVSKPDHPAVFPEEIPKRLMKLFTFVDEMVLDPFAGSGTTAYAAIRHERNALMVDQNPEYVAMMNRGVDDLSGTLDYWGIRDRVTVTQADARHLDFVEDSSIGLVVTSPPYWNKADYGEQDTNLGKISSYKEFFRQMEPALRECYRVLMPGRKLCLVTANVNQHTNHGLLTFPLATDFTNLLREIGFVMVNEVIWSKDKTGGKWGSYGVQRPIFGSYPYPPNLLFKNVHEYILIFAKPPVTPKTGSTVRNYEMLMELPEVIAANGNGSKKVV